MNIQPDNGAEFKRFCHFQLEKWWKLSYSTSLTASKDLPHFLNHSHHNYLHTFVLIQKYQKIKAVNCLTAGFSSTRHHLNGP